MYKLLFSFLSAAKAARADLFITGDFKYHQFFEAENQIAIADIGHYESEQFTKELFYEIVTNDKNAFKNLCEKLPVVIDDVLATIHEDIIDNSVFEELKSINPNILKSLYMLSFSKYEGFDSFDI